MIGLLQKGETFLSSITLEELQLNPAILKQALWIDLLFPTTDEENFIEAQLGLNIPTKEKMHEIEQSSRLFTVGDQLYMACWLLSYESPIPENTSVTFVLSGQHFVSVRYSDHHAFRIFSTRSNSPQERKFCTPDDVLTELFDAMVNHIASTLRNLEQSLNSLSIEIFTEPKAEDAAKRESNLRSVVQRIGKRNSMVSSLRESAVSIQSIAPFITSSAPGRISAENMSKLALLERDVQSLRDYDAQLSSELGFLLDSTVGLISIQQNQSMKILSIAALVLAFI